MVIDRIKDQYSAVLRLAADAPLVKQIDRVTFDLGTIQRMDRYYRDLGVRLLIDLPADLVHLRDRVLVQNVGEIVDVVGGFELGDRLGLRGKDQQQRAAHTEPTFCM